MRHIHWWKRQTLILTSLVLTLAFIVACGAAAPAAPEPGRAPPAAPAEVGQPAAAQTPVAEAASIPEPPAVTAPSGAINSAQPELTRFSAHPRLLTNPNHVYVGFGIGEGLFRLPIQGGIEGVLVASWSISEDGTTWTFNLRQGVQFHKGYGEMTAEDLVWSYAEGWAENAGYPRSSLLRQFWQNEAGFVETPDQYTVVVNSGTPLSDIAMINDKLFSYVTSKRQAEEVGDEAANRNTAATGPWEYLDDGPGFWKMGAVRDHWRKTPYFDEWVLWEIPEESSRLAGFQTGQLDTFSMDFESISVVQNVPGARLMEIPNGSAMAVNIYGQWHVGAGSPQQEAGFNPDLPWVSVNPDPASEEWLQAVKVRQALFMAVDWDSIVENLFFGFADTEPYVRGYGWARHLSGEREWWGYNPERARELMAEAGYPDGFRITLSPVMVRPFEPLTCEAMAMMWEENLGLEVRQQKVAYDAALRPEIVGRTHQGVTCHAGPVRLGPAAQLPLFHSGTVWTPGFNHPWLDEKIDQALASVDPVERERLEGEIGAFIFDNAITHIVPFTLDAVWPVGARLEEWGEHVNAKDLRFISGYEYIQPRQ